MHGAVRSLLTGLTLAVSTSGSPPSPGEPHHESDPPSAEDGSVRLEALVELAQRGDAEAFGLLYDRYVTVVYRYVYVRTGNRQLSEDITSETFLRALRRIDTFSWQGRDIVAWFITIARNLLADERKSARFRLEVATAELLEHRPSPDSSGPPSPEDAVLQRLREERLVEALRKLTPDQAECVLLRFMEGLSLAECAQVLGRKENAVKQLQLRALRALRRELDRAE
jgi:RNA polymerase sigma-70 factor (ECF subfamily)